jgi:NAD(P)-dependent dehydrogenase (short-subunit alcohol dehydrogenase family)
MENVAMRRLTGKVAIVTGSGTGIGAATAKRMVQEGARVVLADINLAAAEQVAAGLVKAGGEAAARRFDLTDEESIRALIAWTVERFGRLDILHNNAADTGPDQVANDLAVAEMTVETWDRAFQANTRGTMLMIKHAIPAMLAAGGGSIINTGSGTSRRGDLMRSAYACSKAAIDCLTMYVAAQYGRRGIRCNAILPGLTLTPTIKAVIPAEHVRNIRSHALLPDLGSAEDLAAAVVFLASDDARNITGQIIPVDGGYISHQPHVGEHLAAMGL